MNILITGGTGFLGQHILKELGNTNNNVMVISRSKSVEFDYVKSIIGDINNYEKINKKVIEFKPEVVIHLAWEGIPDFSLTKCHKNLSNSINFFEYLLNNTNCKKVIVSGSCFEYGKKYGKCIENNSLIIESYFTWAKNALNQYLQIKCFEKDIILNWFRIFYLYGPGQRRNSLIPNLIHSIKNNEPLNIKNPYNKNDFVFVGDVARAFAAAVDNNIPNGDYNLGTGLSSSVYDVCKIVEGQLLGGDKRSKKILHNSNKNETINFCADMKKTKNILKIACETSLVDGIKSHIKSIKSDMQI